MNLADRNLYMRPEKAFTVLEKAQKLEREGKSIIHLEIGEPDFPTPAHISRAGMDAIEQGKTRYTPVLGIPALRQAIADLYPVDPHNVAVTPSTKLALFCALAATVNPGDEVIFPDPGFPAYRNVIEFFGGIAKPVPMVEERNFGFDMDALKWNLSERTKAIILCFPSNPTGSLLPPEDLKFLAEETSAYLISDEVYKNMVYDTKFTSPFSLVPERTIICDGFSKTYSMTGWRVGWMVLPDHLVEPIDNLINNTASCTAEFSQYAALAALQGPQDSIMTMMDTYRERRDFVVHELNTMKGVTCRTPDGAFYAFPNIKRTEMTSKEVAEYLLYNGVALLDGTAFGRYGEGYLRISYATSMEKLQEGMRRMEEALAKI